MNDLSLSSESVRSRCPQGTLPDPQSENPGASFEGAHPKTLVEKPDEELPEESVDLSGVPNSSSDAAHEPPEHKAEFGCTPTDQAPAAEREAVEDPLPTSEAPGSFPGAHPKPLPGPDEHINEALVEYQLQLRDWKLGGALDLSHQLKRALGWYQQFRDDGLLPTKWKGTEFQLPEHIRVTFEPRPVNELGSYTYGRAVRDGTLWNINLNLVAHLEHRRSPAQMAVVLLHELLHLCEGEYLRILGTRLTRSSYHSVEFRRHAQRLGIPCTQNGRELPTTPGSPFAQWVARRGVPTRFEHAEPSGSEDQDPKKKPPVTGQPRAKRPKRVAWRCDCPDAVKVMVPRASTIRFVCEVCSSPVRPVTKDGSTSKAKSP